jgi:hypothetical protein
MRSRRRAARATLDVPEPLESVLDRAGENRFARKKLPIPLARWRLAVGPRVADRTRPIALERGVLIVKVVTSVWANELSMLATQIIERLKTPGPNGAPGIDIQSLRFRVGPLEVEEGISQKRAYRRIPPPVPLTPELEHSIARIEDDELRTLIDQTARANLAWQSKPTK